MVCMMDMGTTNTRLWLYDGARWIGEERGSFGAMFGKRNGRAELLSETRALFERLLAGCGVSEEAVEAWIVSGMAGSEIGLCEIPHVCLPVDSSDLARAIVSVRVEELGCCPILFVPGVKWETDGEIRDLMRGEETELMGILPGVFAAESLTFVLPGTHCKIVRIGKTGKIVEIYTSMSGELLDLVVKNSILADQVRHGASLFERDLLDGKAYAHEYGVPAALFHIRVMEKNGIPSDRLSSFLYGAVLGQDVELIEGITSEDRVLIGGKESLCQIYGALMKHRGTKLSKDVAEYATRNGLGMLYRLYREG